MDFLNYFKQNIISRGYNYYLEGRVLSTSSDRIWISSEVEGSNETYFVKLNLSTPKASHCSCPHAQGGNMCKHMVAVFFTVFPELADLYREETENDVDYYDEYEDYYYDDEGYYDDSEDDGFEYEEEFIRPLYFDELLDDFLNSLSYTQLKEILKEELNKKESYAYNKYLKKHYEMKKSIEIDNPKYMLDDLNDSICSKTSYKLYDYDFESFTLEEKEIINDIYHNHPSYRQQLEKVLLNEDFYTHTAFIYVIKFYLDKLPKNKLIELCDDMQQKLKYIKDLHVKAMTSKSNLLINIYLIKKHLRELELDAIVELLLKNAKYKDFLRYVVKDYPYKKELYLRYEQNLKKGFFNKKEVVDVLEYLYEETSEKSILKSICFYDILFRENVESLDELKKYNDYNQQLSLIIKRCNKDYLLERIFVKLDMRKELFELYYNAKVDYKLIQHAKFLCSEFKEELVTYFKEQFLKYVGDTCKKDEYQKVCSYIEGIAACKDGEVLSELYYYILNTFPRRRLLLEEFERVCWNVSFKKVGGK